MGVVGEFMDWNAETAQTFSQAVAALKKALAQGRTFDEVMAVLEWVDLDVLRILEEEFHFLQTPPENLRERIAYAHLRRLQDPDSYTTINVTARTVSQWADGTLQEWLPGFTDYDDDAGRQYRIKLMDDGTYQVETTEGFGARRFHVVVTVVEAT